MHKHWKAFKLQVTVNHFIGKYLPVAISELVHVANGSGSKNETSCKLQKNVHYGNTKIKCAAIVFLYGSQHIVKHQIHLKLLQHVVTSATLSVKKLISN